MRGSHTMFVGKYWMSPALLPDAGLVPTGGKVPIKSGRILPIPVKPEMLAAHSKRRTSAPLATSQIQSGFCQPAPATSSLSSGEKLA